MFKVKTFCLYESLNIDKYVSDLMLGTQGGYIKHLVLYFKNILIVTQKDYIKDIVLQL